MEIPINMDDLGVPIFSETPICYEFMTFHAFSINTNVGHP